MCRPSKHLCVVKGVAFPFGKGAEEAEMQYHGEETALDALRHLRADTA